MNPIVDNEAWQEARLKHLGAEKALTQQRDELSRQRRELPWLEVTETTCSTRREAPLPWQISLPVSSNSWSITS